MDAGAMLGAGGAAFNGPEEGSLSEPAAAAAACAAAAFSFLVGAFFLAFLAAVKGGMLGLIEEGGGWGCGILAPGRPPGDIPDGDMPLGDIPLGDIPLGGIPDMGIPPGGKPKGGLPEGGTPVADIGPGAKPEAGIPEADIPVGIPDGVMPEGGMPPAMFGIILDGEVAGNMLPWLLAASSLSLSAALIDGGTGGPDDGSEEG